MTPLRPERTPYRLTVPGFLRVWVFGNPVNAQAARILFP